MIPAHMPLMSSGNLSFTTLEPRKVLAVFSLLMVLALPRAVLAQEAEPVDDADRDAAIFGASEEPEAGAAGDDSRDDAIFGTTDEPPTAEPILTKEDLLELEEDILQIGGQLYIRSAYSIQDDTGIDENRFSLPNLLDVYLDARPTDRIRGYVRGRLRYDPTLEDGGATPTGFGASADDGQDATDLFGSTDNPDVLLDQLWLKFDIARTVYLTIGKQPAKWGTGYIWNPLDFLHERHREPLTFFDERTGVSLVKLHIPVESLAWNFYVVAILDGASTLDQVGVAGRAEFVVWTAELALSAKYRKDTAPRFGFDFSAGIWDFDVYGEVALSLGTDVPTYEGDFVLAEDPQDIVLPTAVEHDRDEVVPQVVAGLQYAIQISDEDVMYLGAEYFYNHLGYDNADLYPFLLFQGAMEFFYTGRHYASLFAILPNPGSWEDTNFSLSGIANLSDESFLTRFDFSMTILTWLRLETYVAAHWGTSGGELHFGIDLPEMTLPDGTDSPAIHYAPVRVDLGLNLRVAI